MRELSLHILDVVENAIEAGARLIELTIVENLDADCLRITVADDGPGMDAETVEEVRDPFFTTRSTRHVGLGIPLLAAAAERCEGGLVISSAPGKGAVLRATFQHSHIDRAPLGDVRSTLMCILMRGQSFDLRYGHHVIEHSRHRAFELDTARIRQELGGVPLSYPDVREWLDGFIAQGEQSLKES